MIVITTACEKPKQEPRFPETVTRLLPYGTPYWLDNDRLLLVARAPDDKLYDEEGHWKQGLYILDVRSNTYNRYADLGDPPLFCYNQGFVTYKAKGVQISDRKSDSPEDVFMEGRFGEEKPLPKGVRLGIEMNRQKSYADCPAMDRRAHLTPEHWRLDDNYFRVTAYFLKPEHGYIVASYCSDTNDSCTRIVKEDFEKPAKLYRSGKTSPVELPILGKEFEYLARVRFVEWLGKYLIIPATRRDTPFDFGDHLAGKAPFQVYLMTPEGQVEAFPIPDGKWLGGSDWVATRSGFYFVGNRGTSQGEGGWLVGWDARIQRLHKKAGNVAVSPDGCKLVSNTVKITQGIN